jgi:hypothetical protein
VRDITGHAGFGEEALLGFGVLAPGLGKDLEGDGAADHRVARAIDVRHTSAEEFFEFVFADFGWKLHSGILSRLEAPEHNNTPSGLWFIHSDFNWKPL